MYIACNGLASLSAAIGGDYLAEMQLRFSKYLTLTKTYLVENQYIDREWREEFSAFYSFTFYPNINQFTKRIHLITREITGISDIDKITSEDYLGFIVLRPVPIPNKILKAILVPRKDALGVEEGTDLYIAVCKFHVHIGGKVFSIEAFPFYSQDSMVAICAHAAMFMTGLYMHVRHGMNRPYFRDFVKYTSGYPGRVIPSQGLTQYQMATILASLGFNPMLESFETVDPDELTECWNKIDSYVESALPPLLIYGSHVVAIAGHTLKDGKKNYVLFDDSGYHMETLVGTPYFAYTVPSDALKDTLRDAGSAFLLSFEFERQYFPLKSVEALFNAKLEGETSRRILIMDSKGFKEINRQRNVMEFENISLPHYLWIIEIYSNETLFCEFLVDASAHRDDGNSVIAVWLRNEIKFYKPAERVVDVETFPAFLSNLRRIN